MKKTRLKAIGKIGKRNIAANQELKAMFAREFVDSCEVRLADCMGDFGLSFAHRHKRIWYRKKPNLLSDWHQVVLACAHCHQFMEADKELTKYVFDDLRGVEPNVDVN